MKKNILLFLLAGIYTMASAQIDVSPASYASFKKVEFTPEQLSKLKSSTTYFVIRDSDEEKIQDIKKTIEEVWNVTDYDVVTYTEFIENKLYEKDNTSFFTISGHMVTRSSKNGTSYYVYVYLNLWMNSVNKKGKITEQSYARIELFPTFDTYRYAVWGSPGKKQINPFANSTDYFGLSFSDHLYKDAVIYNYRWPLIKNYLRVVNDCFAKETSRWLYINETDASEIGSLKVETLYIPDYALIKYNAFSGDESKRMEKSELIGKYPYPYKIVTMDELCEIIENSPNPVYYLVYVRSSTDKYITIFNSSTGKIIYTRYKAVSYNMKSGDLMELSKVIAKPPVQK
jgi:hypothetical protein